MAESACIRPRRVPGPWPGAGESPGSPGFRPGSVGAWADPGREPGDPGSSGFAPAFRIGMGSALYPYRVQPHAGRQAGRESLPDVPRKRLAGRQQLAVGELRHVLVEVPPIEPPDHLPLKQSIERLQIDHAALSRSQRSLHRHSALVTVAVIFRRLAEIAAREPMRRCKLHHPRKIAGWHGQNIRTALALNANVTGLPGTRPSSRTASSVTTATSSTPTSAVTCTVPARAWVSRVTCPEKTLRADEASGWRLTKMSVGGTARMAGPSRSVATVMSISPTRACLVVLPAGAPVGSSTRNRFSGVTGDSLPSAMVRMSSAQR